MQTDSQLWISRYTKYARRLLLDLFGGERQKSLDLLTPTVHTTDPRKSTKYETVIVINLFKVKPLYF